MFAGLTPACCRRSQTAFDELDVGGDAAAAEGIYFQADGVARTSNMAPRGDAVFGRRCRGMLVTEERRHGAVEEGFNAVRIDRRARAAQIRIAGNHHTGLRGGRGLLCL